MAEKTLYQFKVTLRETRPPVWRRFQVHSHITLSQFHDIVQVVMGWTNSHPHQFRVGEAVFATPDPDDAVKVMDERKTRLNEVLSQPKTELIYEYDFGDEWIHDLVLESINPCPSRGQYPVVLDGGRKCPPEDVGGAHGYQRFLRAMRNPKDPDYEELREWWGDAPFDPEAFDPKEINETLRDI